MKKKILLFDDVLKTKSGKRIPYYKEQTSGSDNDEDITDQSLHWFHEGYGTMQLYRLHKVEDKIYEYYICEPLKKYCSTGSEQWNLFSEHPELALERR